MASGTPDAAETDGLRRRLGAPSLVMLGVGCIVGAGVYVLTGVAAAHYAGPAVVVSFALAALACGLIGLCYAELAAALPEAGASYSYAAHVLGRGPAWIVGWMMVLEFGLGTAVLAVGFSGYLASLLGDAGLHLPAAISTGTLQATAGGHFAVRPSADLVAFAAVIGAASVLARGVAQGAAANAGLVVVKVGVLALFVLIGAPHVHPAHWHPFVPPSAGGFRFGIAGVLRATSILFFAFLGFEAVATAAGEARYPQRDIPIGIGGALAVSTALYIGVALVMTGLVPFRTLGVADPIAVAVRAIGQPVLATVVKVGAIAGLASVLLVDAYALSRVGWAMARDGLLPPLFGRLDARTATPVWGMAVVALLAGGTAAVLPIALLGDLVSVGTALAFAMVALCVMRLRVSEPDRARPFRVPGGGVRVGRLWVGAVPGAAFGCAALMTVPVLLDLAARMWRGEWLPLTVLVAYGAVGGLIWVAGRRRPPMRA